MLLCLLAVFLMSSCISAMPSMAGPGTLRLHLLPSSSRMAARQAGVVRNGNGSAVLILT
jgi:hypothetical protein